MTVYSDLIYVLRTAKFKCLQCSVSPSGGEKKRKKSMRIVNLYFSPLKKMVVAVRGRGVHSGGENLCVWNWHDVKKYS